MLKRKFYSGAWSKLLSGVPKGFGKFYPKGSTNAAGGAAKTAAQGDAASAAGQAKSNFMRGGGGGGGKKPDHENQWMKLAVAGGGLVLVSAFMFMSSDDKRGRLVQMSAAQLLPLPFSSVHCIPMASLASYGVPECSRVSLPCVPYALALPLS